MDIGALTATLITCAVMAAAVALTAWRIDAVSRRGGGADDYFWVAFGGIVVMIGAGVIAAGASGPGAVVVLGVGVGSIVAAGTWLSRRHRRRRARAAEAVWTRLHERHDAAVQRWADYDVDPAKAIDHPGMHDPASPAARTIVRALRAARAERAEAAAMAGGHRNPPLRYAEAVGDLEHAVDTAEQALGIQGQPRPPVPGGHRADLESLPAVRLRRTPGS